MAARKWTPEQRQRQAALIQQWRPWLQSTGARSVEGKRRSAQNADKGGRRPKLRYLSAELNDLLRVHQDLLRRQE